MSEIRIVQKSCWWHGSSFNMISERADWRLTLIYCAPLSFPAVSLLVLISHWLSSFFLCNGPWCTCFVVEISVKIESSNIRCHVLAEVFGRSPCWSAHSHIIIGVGNLGQLRCWWKTWEREEMLQVFPKEAYWLKINLKKHPDTWGLSLGEWLALIDTATTVATSSSSTISISTLKLLES